MRPLLSLLLLACATLPQVTLSQDACQNFVTANQATLIIGNYACVYEGSYGGTTYESSCVAFCPPSTPLLTIYALIYPYDCADTNAKCCICSLNAPDTEVGGDPWFVGFNGQKFLFQGQNAKWYSLLHDPPFSNVDMRILKPEVSKDSLETYINGLGIEFTSSDGEKQKLSLIVREPENFEPNCDREGERERACIGEGAFEVKINDAEITEPGLYMIDNESYIGLLNSPWECKAMPDSHINWNQFTQAKDVQALRRRLTSNDDRIVLLDQIMKKKVFNSEVCEKWIGERKERGDLFDQKGTMSTIFISSPSLSMRIEYTMNVDETWSNHHRFDAIFTHYSPSRRQTGNDMRSGVLGETAFLKYNEKGEAILSDRDLVLSGKDEDYEVKGPFGTEFKAKTFPKLL